MGIIKWTNKIFQNERTFLWMMVSFKNKRWTNDLDRLNRWNMNDIFQNERNYFLTIEKKNKIGRFRTMNERNEKNERPYL